MRRLALCIALSLAASVAAIFVTRPAFAQKGGGSGGAHEEINLAIGETKTLPATGIKEYSEGVKGVVDVVATPDGRFFVLTGKRAGTTTLLLIRAGGEQTTYDIAVAPRNIQQVEKEVKELTDGVAGIRIRRIGARLFIEGGVSTEPDLRRVQQIAALYGNQVESLVTLGSVAERKLLIRLDFYFVQFNRTSGYTAGIGWPVSVFGNTVQSTYNYDFITRTTTAANASIVNQPLPRLDIAAQHGWAKVVKQSSVITANGSEAKFENGGEANFLQNVGLTTGLVSVKFGTNVNVLPRYDSNSKDVEIKVGADVADLTEPSSANGPPGRNTTKLETLVTLKLGQALILSGIKTATQRHSVAGLPGLSEIPVLGILFGSHSNQKEETEGAVFIVPSIVDTVPKSALELINNAMATYKEYSGDLEYVDVYPKNPPNAK